MAKQKELDGFERPKIKEIDSAAEFYVEQRDKRMRLSRKESEAKQALIAAMRKHKVEVYRDDTSNPPLVVLLSSVDSVKVSEAEPEDDGEEEAAKD